jgi:heme/copper-type cytochrome/quinol oxidase subunit 3
MQVLRYRSREAEREWTARLGMIVFLASWGMLFASLFFAYGIVRNHSPHWPPVGVPHPPLLGAAVNTVLLGASSWMAQRGLTAVAQDPAGAATSFGGAALLGAFFLALQFAIWFGLYRRGLVPSAGAYGSVFYALTCFHALHVLVGLPALGFVARALARRRYGAARYLPARLWTMYWHFVGAVWALMFFLLYAI